jgi:hypothetical protein
LPLVVLFSFVFSQSNLIEYWQDSKEQKTSFIQFRNAVFHTLAKVEINNEALLKAKHFMPEILKLLERVQNEMGNAVESSSSMSRY